jgi:CelD/BcsL family acetyltransferase involved in cellulose biosynthesis
MEYQWIEDPQGFEALAGEWDGALRRSGEDNPFLLSEFILTWWKHYGRGRRLRILIIREGGRLVGGLPLYDHGHGLLDFPGGIAANYTEWLCVDSPQRLWPVLLAALAGRLDWRRIRLSRYRQSRLSSSGGELLAMAQAQGILCDLYESGRTYLMVLSAEARDCLRHLPPRLRTYLRRAERECARFGPVALQSSTQWETVREWFAAYCRFSVASFRVRGQDSAFADETRRRFFRDFLERACRNGYLDANVLTAGPRILAIHFGYSTGDHLNYVLTTFDHELSRWRPGHLLIAKLVELAARRRNPLIDFFTGETLYKRQWSNRQEAVFTVELWRDTVSSRLERRCLKTVRALRLLEGAKRAIRGARSLMRLGRRTRDVVQRLSGTVR